MASGGLTFKAAADGGRLRVEVGGPLTIRTAAHLQVYVISLVRRHAPKVAVIDLRRCALALGRDGFDHLAKESARQARDIDVPMVLLVPPEAEEACGRYCAAVARAGLLRMCHVNPDDALEWSEQAMSWPSSR